MSLEDPHHKSDKGSRTNPDPHGYTTETVVKNMCSAMIIINRIWKHCSPAGSWPIGQLFPWIHRGKRQAQRHIQSQRMHEQNSKIPFCSTVSTLTHRDLVIYTHCTLIVTIEVQFHNYTFLPHRQHLAGSVSQPESSTKPKSEDYAEISITQIMVMLDLLNKYGLVSSF